MIKLLTCEEKLSSGEITIGNAVLSHLPDRKIPLLRRQIGVVPQDILLLDYLTAYDNIAYALTAMEVEQSQIKALTTAALEIVGMLDYGGYYPYQLSQGQQQKVIIARAVANKPKIIIADEPTANLDTKSAIEIMRIFYHLNQLGSIVLMATHNSTIVNTIRYRVLEINSGRLVRDQRAGGYGLVNDEKDIFII